MKNRRKTNKRRQKVYKMKGCSRKNRKGCLGGGGASNVNLSYPTNNIKFAPNPFLAYTGKGGSCSTNSAMLQVPQNTDGANAAYPSTGPVVTGFNFLNPQGTQHGGSCGSCGSPFQFGGIQTEPLVMKGGHCPECSLAMKGGSAVPNGLIGSAWTPNSGGWPGVDGIDNNRNHLPHNNYSPNDVSRQMISTGANPPFSIGGRKTRSNKLNKGKKGKKGQRGGVLSNLLSQDFINLGRQAQFGLGSAYNAINGYSAPVNPLPWKGQLPNTPTLAALKTASL
jgi:hypothetical protein